MNKSSLARVYGEALKENGTDMAYPQLVAHQSDTSHYILREGDMNELGYELMDDGYLALALETLKINTLLFQNSANAYESYGEALEKNGNKAEAILLYQKALLIDPKNIDAAEQLKKLEAERIK